MENVLNKGKPNSYVPLNERSKIDARFLPESNNSQVTAPTPSTSEPTIDPTLQKCLDEDGVTLTEIQRNNVIAAQNRKKNNHTVLWDEIGNGNLFNLIFPHPLATGSVIGVNMLIDGTVHRGYVYVTVSMSGTTQLSFLNYDNDTYAIFATRIIQETGDIRYIIEQFSDNYKFSLVNDSPLFGCWTYTLYGCDIIPVGGWAFTNNNVKDPVILYGGNTWKQHDCVRMYTGDTSNPSGYLLFNVWELN